jgi:hypothetical protein
MRVKNLISQIDEKSEHYGVLKGEKDVRSGNDILFPHQLPHVNITSKRFENASDFCRINGVEISKKRHAQHKKQYHPILE